MAAKSKTEGASRCFFITPIGDEGSPERQRADWIFYHVVKPSAEGLGMLAERADLMRGASMIGTNIFRALSESKICIADMTGLNPNVLYEMGVRHTLRRPIIHIAQIGTRLPFDTAPHLTHFYDLSSYSSMSGLKGDVVGHMEEIGASGYEVTNPFTQALGAIEVNLSGDDRDKMLSLAMERLDRIESYSYARSFGDRVSAKDYESVLRRFIETSDYSEKPYNEETFRRALNEERDNFELLVEVYNSLRVSKRPNRANLQSILNGFLELD